MACAQQLGSITFLASWQSRVCLRVPGICDQAFLWGRSGLEAIFSAWVGMKICFPSQAHKKCSTTTMFSWLRIQIRQNCQLSTMVTQSHRNGFTDGQSHCLGFLIHQGLLQAGTRSAKIWVLFAQSPTPLFHFFLILIMWAPQILPGIPVRWGSMGHARKHPTILGSWKSTCPHFPMEETTCSGEPSCHCAVLASGRGDMFEV